jgi:tetratricopeptide (TPR) repeat protein
LDLALSYLNNSLIIEKNERNNEGIVYAELGIADVYIRIERFTDASIVLQKTAKRISEDQIEETIILHKLFGKLFRQTGKLKPALSEFIKGESISRNYKIRTHLLELLKLQIEIHEQNKDWQKATFKYAEYVKLNEEMNSFQIKNQLDDLNYRNELTKKQLEIELVQEERDLARKNEQLEKDLRIFGQKITWFVILLLLSSIILIIAGTRKLTNRNK